MDRYRDNSIYDLDSSGIELTFTGAGRTQRVVQQATTTVRVP